MEKIIHDTEWKCEKIRKIKTLNIYQIYYKEGSEWKPSRLVKAKNESEAFNVFEKNELNYL